MFSIQLLSGSIYTGGSRTFQESPRVILYDVLNGFMEICEHIKKMSARSILMNHSNSLEPLPFPDGEFDLIRLQKIGLGVPEDEVKQTQ